MAKEISSSKFEFLIPKLDSTIWYFIYPILKFKVEKIESEVEIHLYEFSVDEKIFYLILKYHKYEKLIIVGNTNFENGVFENQAMIEIFPLILEKLKNEEFFECVLPTFAHQKFEQLMKESQTHPHLFCCNEAIPFVVDKQHEKILFEKEIDLPKGFEMHKLEPKHAEEMMKQALYTQKGDVEQAALRISELPSIGIFKENTDELVAFEYNDGLGLIAHQFVYPKFRNQGFGKIVEIIISQKNITELGIRPAKTVAVCRSKAQTMTEKAGYWTRVLDVNGKSASVWWSMFSKTSKKQIEIYEN